MQKSDWSKEVNISIILLVNVASTQQNIILPSHMEDSVLGGINSSRNYTFPRHPLHPRMICLPLISGCGQI